MSLPDHDTSVFDSSMWINLGNDHYLSKMEGAFFISKSDNMNKKTKTYCHANVILFLRPNPDNTGRKFRLSSKTPNAVIKEEEFYDI